MTRNLYLALCFLLLLAPPVLDGQPLKLHDVVIGGGGMLTEAGGYTLHTTVGQPLAGHDTSSSSLRGIGFWSSYAAMVDVLTAGYGVDSSWNLVSVPKTVADYHVPSLFPTATSKAYYYDNGYHPTDSLRNGLGYWLKFGRETIARYWGEPRYADTVEVRDKWNIIGSIFLAALIDSIIEIPPGIVTSSYFGFGSGYHVSDALEPGKGYWVKANGSGKLVLRSWFWGAPPVPKGVLSAELEDLNTISVESEVSPRSGHQRQQSLYFGKTAGKSMNTDRFEMPPKPPTGAIDARFSSDRFVELIPDSIEGVKELPLSLQANGQPLTLRWSMKEKAGVKYTLIERIGGRVIQQRQLATDGAISVQPDERKTYAIGIERIPYIFALYQNYPNPFNPATVIRYQLSQPVHLTLKVYDILGREVTTLVDEKKEAGEYMVRWDASESASGVYFYRLIARDISTVSKQLYVDTKKLMLVR